MKSEYSLSTSSLLGWVDLCYSTFMRWKRRVERGDDPVKKPGPKKISPIDIDMIDKDIGLLCHGPKRTRRTGELYQKFKESISRRSLGRLVRRARYFANTHQYIVKWRYPDLVWAIDGLEIITRSLKPGLHVQNLQDLCSTYKFSPLLSLKKPGSKEVAGYLSSCFNHFGPPLFLKKDNAWNFNGCAVNDLLKKKMVIPLNNPYYYAPYNGGIEHAQGEFKTYVQRHKDKAATIKELLLLIELGSHDLNHKPRRILNGKNACQSYFNMNRLRIKKRERKEIFDWIKNLAIDISNKKGMDKIDPVAWRVACRKWMEKNDMITIGKRKVLPNLSLNLCHN